MYTMAIDCYLWVWFVVRLVLWFKVAVAGVWQGSLALRTRTGG